MISLEEAHSRLLALVKPLEIVRVSLLDAAGSWAASDLVSKRTQPVRDLSAMDGYAVASGSAGPWRVIGESAAGRPFENIVGALESVRIFTGSALPEGTDTILIQENVTREGDAISVEPINIPRPLQHVRQKGSDFRAGDILVKAGDRFTAARLALAASGGHGHVAIRRKPRIALIATGDELIPPGQDAGSDLLPESNTVMVAAMFRDSPCDILRVGIVPDDIGALVAAIRAVDADMLITMGGASVGDHDLVKPALEQCGANLDFWKVSMRPGKPVTAGLLGDMVVLGLPGNPVSAFVTALLFAKPVAAILAGASDPLPQTERVLLGSALLANGDRTDHMRGRMTASGAVPTGLNDSAALGGLAAADLLIVRPPGAPMASIGDEVTVIRIN